MTIYSYIRISEVEGEQGGAFLRTAIDNELDALSLQAEKMGLEAPERFIDRHCQWRDTLSERPRGKAMLSVLKSGDVVLLSHLLRMFSSCEEMDSVIQDFRRQGITLYVHDLAGAVTDIEFSVPFSLALDLFQQLEQKRAAERIKTVKRRQKREGRYLGGSRPFGYTVDSNGSLVDHPAEQQVLKRILGLRSEGKSLRAISAEVSSPEAPISFKTVQRIIKRHESMSLEAVDRRRPD